MISLDTLATPKVKQKIKYYMIAWLITALGLVLVLEGLVYAVFPRQMKSMLKSIIEYSDNTLVWIGMLTALSGLFLIWLVRT